jgi:valyl-tRNA synthetase
MSKTKGNVLDPIEVIEKYGTDATRFTLASMSSPGTDIAFNPSRTEGYRAFANKIWNAARFMFMNVDRAERAGIWRLEEFRSAANSPSTYIRTDSFTTQTLEDRWIFSLFNQVTRDVNESLKVYRFDDAANRIYEFFWGAFCDWYIELIKPRLIAENDNDAVTTACANLVQLFEASLRLLHPVMPFITEEIWQAIYDKKRPHKSIALAPYPQTDEMQIDVGAETEMAILQELIVGVRNSRAELKIEPKVKVPIQLFSHDLEARNVVEQNRTAVQRLANVETILGTSRPLVDTLGARRTARFDFLVIYEKKINLAAERERLNSELEKIEREIASGQRQLDNKQFLAKAPEHVVAGIRKRAQELAVQQEKTKSQLEALGQR